MMIGHMIHSYCEIKHLLLPPVSTYTYIIQKLCSTMSKLSLLFPSLLRLMNFFCDYIINTSGLEDSVFYIKRKKLQAN